jgi:hypothetical protein
MSFDPADTAAQRRWARAQGRTAYWREVCTDAAFKNVRHGAAALKSRKIYPMRTVETSDAFSGRAIDRGNLETNALNYRTELECSDYKIIRGIIIRADAGSRETRRLQSQPAQHRPELKIK